MIDSIIEVSKNTMQRLRLEMKIQPFNLESRVLTIFKWFQIMKWYKYWLHIDYSVCTTALFDSQHVQLSCSEERTLGESVLLGASGRTIAGITLLLETIVKTRHEVCF